VCPNGYYREYENGAVDDGDSCKQCGPFQGKVHIDGQDWVDQMYANPDLDWLTIETIPDISFKLNCDMYGIALRFCPPDSISYCTQNHDWSGMDGLPDCRDTSSWTEEYGNIEVNGVKTHGDTYRSACWYFDNNPLENLPVWNNCPSPLMNTPWYREIIGGNIKRHVCSIPMYGIL